jgi:Raf kinase inhibitor-like YbhB/YbcL family protein
MRISILIGFLLFLFSTSPVSGATTMALTIISPVFLNNGMIPTRYTCEGEDISPPLAFGGIPPGTASLALIVDDPDAPDPAAPKMTWVHWLVYNFDPAIAGLSGGVTELSPPAMGGRNDFGRTRYGGPCPPIGNHRYMFKLYALDTMLPDLGTPDKETLLRAMEGHILDKAVLIGRYQKQR